MPGRQPRIALLMMSQSISTAPSRTWSSVSPRTSPTWRRRQARGAALSVGINARISSGLVTSENSLTWPTPAHVFSGDRKHAARVNRYAWQPQLDAGLGLEPRGSRLLSLFPVVARSGRCQRGRHLRHLLFLLSATSRRATPTSASMCASARRRR